MGTRGTLGQQLSRNVHPQPERVFTEWVSRFFLPSEAGPPKSSPHGREQQGRSSMPACSQTWMRSASDARVTGLGLEPLRSTAAGSRCLWLIWPARNWTSMF